MGAADIRATGKDVRQEMKITSSNSMSCAIKYVKHSTASGAKNHISPRPRKQAHGKFAHLASHEKDIFMFGSGERDIYIYLQHCAVQPLTWPLRSDAY